MQIDENSDLGYNSPYWKNDALLNENSSPTDSVNAKYEAFLSIPFYSIRMCTGDVDTKCVSYTFDRTWDSAKDLFNSGYQPATDLNKLEIRVGNVKRYLSQKRICNQHELVVYKWFFRHHRQK